MQRNYTSTFRSNACLFFKLLTDTVRDITSLDQLCLLASPAHHKTNKSGLQ